MSLRTYGQYCGFARALEIVGERWGLLIVRDLLVGPKRFTDLHLGLPGIPTNVLAARLKELEQASVIRRKLAPRPAGSVIYELTEYGQELKDTVVALGRWGAKSLGEPQPGETATADSLIMALRTTFRSQAARGVHASYELRFGPLVIHARIKNGALETGCGPLSDADLTIETGPAIKALMAGEVSSAEALAKKIVRIKGNRKLLDRFAEVFRI